MKRSKPLRKSNPKRKKKLWERQFGSQERLDWLKSRPCVCGKKATDAHHVRSRGAGGSADDMVPLCRECHNYIHQRGQHDYESHFGVRLRAAATMYAKQWEESRRTAE